MRFIVLITALLTLGGCAGNGPLLITYPVPPPEKAWKKTESTQKISVELFKQNNRPMVTSPYIIKDIQNIIGVYNKDKSEVIVQSLNKIDEVLQQALVTELKHAGYTVVEEGAEVNLAGRINSFSASFIRTQEDYLLANVQVYLKVHSPNTGKVLYENHYLAGSMLEVSDPPANSDFVEVMESGLVRLVRKVLNDKALLAVLQVR